MARPDMWHKVTRGLQKNFRKTPIIELACSSLGSRMLILTKLRARVGELREFCVTTTKRVSAQCANERTDFPRYATLPCRRPIKMSLLCQLQMTLPRRISVGVTV